MFPDVVVIGGGIIGACCAYYLSQAGLNVHLVERGGIASGCSGACQFGIGHINTGIGRELTVASGKLYASLAEQLPLDIEYDRVGNIYIADNPRGMKALERTAQLVQSSGMRCQLLNREDLLALEPHLSPELVGGLFFPEDAKVQPILATLAFVKAAKAKGATVQTFTEVTGFELSANRAVMAVHTTNGRIPTKIVVNAAGAWSAGIGKMVGIEIPIIPRKGHIVVTEPVPPMINTYLLDASYFEAVEEDAHRLAVAMVLGQTRNGNILLGSSRQFAGFDRSVDHEAVRAMITRCLRFLPALADIHAIRMYAGLRPYTPDLLPIIDEADEVPGFYIAAGHEGEGITMGPITGKLMSQMITGQELDLPVEELSLSRFAQARLSLPA
ncbi:MAG: FAD-binding oxidoreductase [Chloroflexi bacterium]|nr:FAD-binding oxidoreductase [Chloroflexota bacterium]